MSNGSWQKTWTEFFLLIGIPLALIDAHYVMPNYHISTGGGWFWQVGSAYLRYLLGPVFIILGLIGEGFAFNGSTDWGASALVMWGMLLPILAVASFYIEGPGEVPPAYWLFQFAITDSGAGLVDAKKFNASAYAAKVQRARQDRYQAKLEAEELRQAAERARAEARRLEEQAKRSRSEEIQRVKAAEDAAKAAEEKYRAAVRARTWEDKGGRG